MMEMSSGCTAPDIQPLPLRPRPVRGPHGGWQKQEIDTLQKHLSEAEQTGESLRSVFDRAAAELGRKPNSIRNFYYAQLRTQSEDAGRALPFETFSPAEVEQLVERVIIARAQGMSVRACVRQLADGDRTLMLRYQNKYRSTIRTRPELVRRIMDRLRAQDIAFVSPYGQEDEDAADFSALQSRAQHSGDPQLHQLFSSLDYLLNLALSHQEENPALPQDSEAQRRADRLGARLDMLRIALDDEQMRRQQLKTETEGMISLIKEYIALPDCDRIQHTDAFCRQAAERLSAVECALMEPDE